MAKEPVTRDRFRIFAETGSESMGPLLAMLTRMGLENIGYELVTDVRTFGKNERKVHDTPSHEFLAAWVQENPTFKTTDAVKHFRDNDRQPASCYGALKRLVSEGTLRRLDAGSYQRSDVHAIAPPTAAGEPKPRTRPPSSPKNEITNAQLIEKAVRHRKKVTLKELAALLTDNGRAGKSASPIVSGMIRDGILRLIEPGEYAVVANNPKAGKRSAAPAKPKQTAEEKREIDRVRAQAKRDREKQEKLALNGPGTHQE